MFSFHSFPSHTVYQSIRFSLSFFYETLMSHSLSDLLSFIVRAQPFTALPSPPLHSDQYYSNATSMPSMRNVLVVTMPNTRSYNITDLKSNNTVRIFQVALLSLEHLQQKNRVSVKRQNDLSVSWTAFFF